jgi:hypothetical protein
MAKLSTKEMISIFTQRELRFFIVSHPSLAEEDWQLKHLTLLLNL